MAGVLIGTLSLTNFGATHRTHTSDALDATNTASTVTCAIGGAQNVTMQAVTASLTGTIQFKLQCSNDSSNFTDIPGATGSINTAAGNSYVHLIAAPGIYLKFVVTSAGGAGTITPSFTMKGC